MQPQRNDGEDEEQTEKIAPFDERIRSFAAASLLVSLLLPRIQRRISASRIGRRDSSCSSESSCDVMHDVTPYTTHRQPLE